MTRQPDSTWEVKAEGREARKRDPFCQTFTNHDAATDYARAMRRAGYVAEVSGPYKVTKTLATALKTAAQFFNDDSLAPGSVKPLDRWQ